MRFKCQVCGQPATIHETVIQSGGKVVSEHYCHEHGEDVRCHAPQSDSAVLAALGKRYADLPEPEKLRLQLDGRVMRRS